MSAHAKIFRAAGHEVVIICQRGQGDDRAVRILSTAPESREVANALDGVNLAIIHNVMTMPFDMELTAALWEVAAAHPRTRFVGWIHDLAALNEDYSFDRQAEPWNRLSAASPHFDYIAVSDFRARQFKSLTGISPWVIPNGVDSAQVLGLTPAVAAFADEINLHERELRLLHPARFVRRKNIELGLDVIAALRAAGRDPVLLVTGAADSQNRGPNHYQTELESRRRELDLSRHAFFLSENFAVTSADMKSLYGAVDALFFPSHHEGFGLPLLEAALHRLPIFCPDIEPMNTFFSHGIHAYPPSAGAPEIAALVTATLDADAAFQARQAVLSRFTWQAVATQFLQPFLNAQSARA